VARTKASPRELWSLGRALCWVAWRDPGAHPVRWEGGEYYPYPWDDLAAPDGPVSYISVFVGPHYVVPCALVSVSTDRRAMRTENSPFHRLAMECAAGDVRAFGREPDKKLSPILAQEWRGPDGLSDHWVTVWLDADEMLQAFPARDRSVEDRPPETHSGMPGRPSAKYLYEVECRRRHDAGEAKLLASKEAEVLFKWLGQKYPEIAPGSVKTIANNIRLWRRAWASTK
jgi:hypothetical protein